MDTKYPLHHSTLQMLIYSEMTGARVYMQVCACVYIFGPL